MRRQHTSDACMLSPAWWRVCTGCVLYLQVKAKIKEPEFEVPAGSSPAYAKALRKKARLAAKKDSLQVRRP